MGEVSQFSRLCAMGCNLECFNGGLAVLEIREMSPAALLDEFEAIRDVFVKSGALLIRYEGPIDFSLFGRLTEIATGGKLLNYRERSSPRTEVADRIYTSTDYPQRERINFHNENSYQLIWPDVIAFWCKRSAPVGGRTPISDVSAVMRGLSGSAFQRLREEGYLIVRNYAPGLGLAWRDVFSTSDRASVDRYCCANSLTAEWLNGALKTTAHRKAVHRHRTRNVDVWFNHLAFFNIMSLRPVIRDTLLASVEMHRLPTNTYYADGSAIEKDVIEQISAAYEGASVRFDWRPGDMLFLDNMLYAHAREPYRGERELFTALASRADTRPEL